MSDVGRPTGGDQPHTLSQAGDGSQLSLKLLASDSQPPGADLQERREQVKDQTEQAARQLDETQKTYDAAKRDATDLIKHLNVSIELIDTACDKLDEQHHDLLGRSKPEVSGRHDAHLMDDLLYAQFMYNHQALLERLQTQEERLAAADIHDIADSVH
ncbi:MAG: hypothetical protein J2P36_07945, partial [Ktedonobacteraceae bacterium]|nr:hypothetical protein [Ktedonobacteraceae bacterium]